jgi:hypothetical protein
MMLRCVLSTARASGGGVSKLGCWLAQIRHGEGAGNAAQRVFQGGLCISVYLFLTNAGNLKTIFYLATFKAIFANVLILLAAI